MSGKAPAAGIAANPDDQEPVAERRFQFMSFVEMGQMGGKGARVCRSNFILTANIRLYLVINSVRRQE